MYTATYCFHVSHNSAVITNQNSSLTHHSVSVLEKHVTDIKGTVHPKIQLFNLGLKELINA